jgi:IS66 C-terminal element
MYTLIHTAKLNAVDPQVWLADVLARIADHPVNRVDELLPRRNRIFRVRRLCGRLLSH